MIRILIAEFHSALRAALRSLLGAEPDIEIVGEAGDTSAMLGLAGELRPDVIVLDIGLPDLHGFEALRQLSHALPTTQILLLTDYHDPCLVRDAVIAGAAGCVASQDAGSTLVAAVRTVGLGNLYVQPDTVRALLADLIAPAAWSVERRVALTPREEDVLRLVALGFTNRQVAAELDLSVQAVESARDTIMIKIGLHSRVELVRYAALRRLIETPS
jgi:two-component system response regulator NreC